MLQDAGWFILYFVFPHTIFIPAHFSYHQVLGDQACTLTGHTGAPSFALLPYLASDFSLCLCPTVLKAPKQMLHIRVPPTWSFLC